MATFSRSVRFGLFASASLLGLLAQQCAKTDESKRAQVTEGCVVNSDCNVPYVCTFEARRWSQRNSRIGAERDVKTVNSA